MDNENTQHSSKKIIWIIAAILVIVALIIGGLYWYAGKNPKVKEIVGKVLPFGELAENVNNSITSTNNEVNPSNPEIAAVKEEPLFRQLSAAPVAGAYPLEKEGVEYVRYIEKETGFAYEINLSNGEKRQLTNTPVPRVHEAIWGYGGKAVVLRYLEQTSHGAQDTIATLLGYIDDSANATDTGAVTELRINHLPNDAIAVSISPDGNNLFYMTKTDEGVIGSIINLATKTTTGVFRSPFTEWIPELMNNGDIILTTKPSAKIPGFAYRYDTKTASFERLAREKDGMTEHVNNNGTRFLFSENISNQVILGIYDPKGFTESENDVLVHEKTLPLTTLAEKCAWRKDGISLYCGSFSGTPNEMIPDAWYRGTYSFTDTFWTVNTKTNELEFIADPQVEISKQFDVINPFVSTNEDYFIFTDKKEGTLWSLHIKPKVAPENIETANPELTPEELKDIQGSTPAPAP